MVADANYVKAEVRIIILLPIKSKNASQQTDLYQDQRTIIFISHFK